MGIAVGRLEALATVEVAELAQGGGARAGAHPRRLEIGEEEEATAATRGGG